jgi:hypothetical protein
MNPSLNSDPTLYGTAEAGAHNGSGYPPSVPISVYRELAIELQATKAMVDALTQQNQQLLRQNKLIRNEVQRFVLSAEQLGQFAGVAPKEPGAGAEASGSPAPPPMAETAATSGRSAEKKAAKGTMPQHLAIVPRERDRPQPSTNPAPQVRLFTEQRTAAHKLEARSGRTMDLGNLWLVTTILLVVLTAFGAGFLIMRPLLQR